jgi:hypothetical protein
MYGNSPACDFGPIALKTVRQRFVSNGQSRRTVNDNVSRLKRMFRWALSEELLHESVVTRLSSVDGLRKGKSDAREPDPIPPVPDDIVDQTLSHLPKVVADMVRIARYTGVRPGEICASANRSRKSSGVGKRTIAGLLTNFAIRLRPRSVNNMASERWLQFWSTAGPIHPRFTPFAT